MHGKVAWLLEFVALAHVPAAGREDLFAAWQDGYVIDDRFVRFGPGHELSGLGIPQAERLVKTATHQMPAIRREGEPCDAASMGKERLSRHAGRGFAQVYRPFTVGCGDLRTVGRE